MTEPATALTDFLLAGLALVAALRLVPKLGQPALLGAPIFFAAFGLAAVLGGIWHGFANDNISAFSRMLWWATVVSTGAAAAGLAGVGLEGLGLANPSRTLIGLLAVTTAVAIYAWFDPRFLVSIIVTAVASLLCLAGLARRWQSDHRNAAALAATGILMSIVAAVLQQQGLAVHPVHFDHNGTYHVLLLPALALFYTGNRRLLEHG